MADRADVGISELTTGVKKITISKDDVATQITLCTWNTMGESNAEINKHRPRVTKATFEGRFYGDGTSLAQSDIICVQEMTVSARTQQRNDLKYIPAYQHSGVQSKEPTGSKYNTVYFKVEKFHQVAHDYLRPAYERMDFKKRCFDFIQRGGYDKINKATKGLLLDTPRWVDTDDKSKIFEEVRSECRDAGTLIGFNMAISKYQAPGESVLKDPSDLLDRRMAICALRIKSLPKEHHDIIIVVASVHNYSGRSGKGSPERYASLLFDFLSKMPCNCIVIIAGDFNFDILTCRDRSLTRYFPSYHIPRYPLRPLRGSSTIDFVVVTKSKADAMLQVSVQAHDLQVPRDVEAEIGTGVVNHRKITNHSPVSAVIELKLKKKD